MTKISTANFVAAVVLLALMAMAMSVGISGTVDAAYDVGFFLGSMARAL